MRIFQLIINPEEKPNGGIKKEHADSQRPQNRGRDSVTAVLDHWWLFHILKFNPPQKVKTEIKERTGLAVRLGGLSHNPIFGGNQPCCE